MKDVFNSYTMSNNLYFGNYWREMVLSQYIKRSLRFLTIEKVKIMKGSTPTLVVEMFPFNEENI